MDNDESTKEKILFTGPKFNPTKKYGLIIPNKAGSKPNSIPKKAVKPCIFDEDEDDDISHEKSTTKTMDTKFTPFNSKTSTSRLKKQTQIAIEKALSEDPNVFEYDNVYDEMEKEKGKIDPKQKEKNQSKEPKYIAGIMKAAAKRQMDFEKHQERKIHRERQEEGDLWQDKETFVTSAYRKKMEERQKIEEEERNQDKIEELLDVRKQKDLSGFYSNLLKMKTGELVVEEEGAKDKRIENEEKNKEQQLNKQKKIYRKKRDTSDEEESDQEPMDTTKENESDTNIKKEPEKESIVASQNDKELEKEEPQAKKIKTEETAEVETIEDEPKETKVKEPKMTKEERRAWLFTKRTVGAKFDQELSEYFMRKAVLEKKSYIEREN